METKTINTTNQNEHVQVIVEDGGDGVTIITINSNPKKTIIRTNPVKK